MRQRFVRLLIGADPVRAVSWGGMWEDPWHPSPPAQHNRDQSGSAPPPAPTTVRHQVSTQTIDTTVPQNQPPQGSAHSQTVATQVGMAPCPKGTQRPQPTQGAPLPDYEDTLWPAGEVDPLDLDTLAGVGTQAYAQSTTYPEQAFPGDGDYASWRLTMAIQFDPWVGHDEMEYWTNALRSLLPEWVPHPPLIWRDGELQPQRAHPAPWHNNLFTNHMHGHWIGIETTRTQQGWTFGCIGATQRHL